MLPSETASELDGMQDDSVLVVLVTVSMEQVLLVKAGLLPVTQTMYAPVANVLGIVA